MHYRDMRTVFTQLPADGRLTVHLAYQTTPPAHQELDSGAPSWTVVLRDNARVPIPDADIRYLYCVADSACLARLDESPAIAGLCSLDATADPACRLTWTEVLRVLDVLATSFSAWQIKAIVGTLEPEPRYGVTLQTEIGAPRPLPSLEAFDRLCLEAGPLGPRATHPGSPAIAVGVHDTGVGAEMTSCRQPVTALVFAPERQPRSCTLGSLDWLAPAGVATWVDLCAPSRDEVLAVARQLRLPYRAALATLSPASDSWCHAYQDHICIRVPVARRDPLSGRIQAEALDLIVGPRVVVSIHASPLPALVRARRRVSQRPDQSETTVPTLFGAILSEVLSSEEALARWLVQESAAIPTYLEQLYDLRQAQKAAVELQQLVERRQELLAAADRIARHLHGLALIPWWGHVEDRRERLLATLRRAEESAEEGLRHRASMGHGRRSLKVERARLWIACTAVVLAGLISLAALHPLRQTIVLIAIAGVPLVVATIAVLSTVATRERLRERRRAKGTSTKSKQT